MKHLIECVKFAIPHGNSDSNPLGLRDYIGHMMTILLNREFMDIQFPIRIEYGYINDYISDTDKDIIPVTNIKFLRHFRSKTQITSHNVFQLGSAPIRRYPKLSFWIRLRARIFLYRVSDNFGYGYGVP